MANRQFKNEQPASAKTDDQIINDLIENRKRQMEALIKIMSSIDEGGEVAAQIPVSGKRKGSKNK